MVAAPDDEASDAVYAAKEGDVMGDEKCQHRNSNYIRSRPFMKCGEPATMLIELADGQIRVPMCKDHGYDTLADDQLDARAVNP